jgi:ArsR family transcriptional regulator
MNGYALVAKTLKALAHPIRLQILKVLQEEGEACVCHMEARINRRQAYISQHLAKLRQLGLVTDRREGLNVFYALSIREIDPLLEQARRLAAEAAGFDESELPFDEIRKVPPEQCDCPKCEQKLSLVVDQLQADEPISS